MDVLKDYKIADISESEREKIVSLEQNIKAAEGTNIVLIAYECKK